MTFIQHIALFLLHDSVRKCDAIAVGPVSVRLSVYPSGTS